MFPTNNGLKDSNENMILSGNFPITDMPLSYSYKIQTKPRFRSLIALGNPIVDISAEINKESIEKYHLSWGETVFADQYNVGFFQELENMPRVTYIPGGSIQNTLRVTAWCLFMDQNNKNNYKVTMLGATGKDNYRDKIINAFKYIGVNPILEMIPNMQTSRCGVGINQKERCLLPEIRASNCITEEFINEHQKEIDEHDALLIEGYFLQEKFELCKNLCTQFKVDRKKIVILTLSAVTIVQNNYDKVLDICNYSDIIVGNMAELEELARVKNVDYKTTIEKASKNLSNKERLFVITTGSKGVIVGKYDYKKENMDFILQSFPNVIKSDEIVDLNGAGDAFLGGFLSQYMQGKKLTTCCKAGNDAASVILKNIGCTFNKNSIIHFRD